MCSVCTSSALHFSHSFCFISIYCCCLQSASRLLQHVFLEKWKIKNRVGRLVFASIWVLAFDRKFVSRRMFTLYTHTLTRCAAHTTRQHTYLRYIYSNNIINTGGPFVPRRRRRLHVRCSIYAWEERFYSIFTSFYFLSASSARIIACVDIFFLLTNGVWPIERERYR